MKCATAIRRGRVLLRIKRGYLARGQAPHLVLTTLSIVEIRKMRCNVVKKCVLEEIKSERMYFSWTQQERVWFHRDANYS